MSDVRGKIGQMYENRKSRKQGLLVEIDESKRQYLMKDEKGDIFPISFGSFKSNWRKSTEEPTERQAAVEPAMGEVNGEEPVKEETPHGDDGVDVFIATLKDVRPIRFSHDPKKSDVTTLYVDELAALTLTKDDGGIRITALPDIYTYSTIKNHVLAGTLRFNAKGHLSVSFVADYEDFGAVLYDIREAVAELNLYGYKLED